MKGMRSEANERNRSILTISAVTVAFLLLALFNLGTLHIPSSYWQPSSACNCKTEVIVRFGGQTHNDTYWNVSAIYVFLGDANVTKFEVFSHFRSSEVRSSEHSEHESEWGEWRKELTYDNTNDVRFCNWVRLALNRRTDALKFVFEPTDGKIGEILVVSSEGRRIPVRVSDYRFVGDANNKDGKGRIGGVGNSNGNSNLSDPRALFDEQEEIELPITQKNGAYFDEMYFVRTAWEHLHLQEPYETTHPPLGKLIIAFGIILFGMNPFGWRILGVISAAAMIPIIYLLAKRLFGRNSAGCIAAFLLAFDFMHFSLARLATGEIYIFLFSLLSFFFFHEYLRRIDMKIESERRVKQRVSESENKSEHEAEHETEHETEHEAARRALFLSVLCCGLWFAVKWTAFYGFITILILFLLLTKKENIRRDFNVILAGVFASAAIYIITYIPYMLSGGGHPLFDIGRLPLYAHYISEYLKGNATDVSTLTSIFSPITVFDLQIGMFTYHATLNATHPFSSPWWSWPLMLKPLWLFVNPIEGDGVSTVVLMGNPVIWWSAIPAIAAIAVAAFRNAMKRGQERERANHRAASSHSSHNTTAVTTKTATLRKQLFILIPFFSLWLPYALIPRILFIYHFAPDVTFLILALTYWLDALWNDDEGKALSRGIVIAFLILVAAVFVLFYPVISGIPVPNEYRDSLKWLPDWYF